MNMLRVQVVVREVGGLKPEYSMAFDLPYLPRVGSYLSIERPGLAGETQDLIVRQVWWRLSHPHRDDGRTYATAEGVGEVDEITIECAKAIGPHSTERWREELLAAERNGIEVDTFDVEPSDDFLEVARFADQPVRTEVPRSAARRPPEDASVQPARPPKRQRRR